jgi:hypothetical protein
MVYGGLIWFLDSQLLQDIKDPINPKTAINAILLTGWALSSVVCCILPYIKLHKNKTI